MSLRPQLREELYSRVALGLEDLSSAATNAADVLNARAIIDNVVDEAFAHFAARWNSMNLDVLSRLPFELHVACLIPLDRRDRERASVVCRRWRNVALQAPILWTECPPGLRNTQYLITLLARSNPHPFDLRWSGEVTDDIRAIVNDNMHRVIRLDVQRHLVRGACATWLSNAPMLRIATFGTKFRLPSKPMAPLLHTLNVQGIAIPKNVTPLCTVLTFNCDSWLVQSDFRRLPSAFPNLEHLTLRNVTNMDRLPLTLPLTLRQLTLTGYDFDYTHHIRSWRDCQPSECISLSGSIDLESIIEFFVDSTAEDDWTLTWLAESDMGVILQSAAATTIELSDFTVNIRSLLLDIHRLFTRLVSLTVSVRYLEFFAEPIELPAVTSLTVTIVDTDYADYLKEIWSENFDTDDLPVLYAPELKTVTFSSRTFSFACIMLNSRSLNIFVPCFDGYMLDSITISTPDALDAFDECFYSFDDFAREVHFRDPTSGTVQTRR